VADLTAEADWEASTSLWLGVWLAVAPWLLGFADDRSATFMHFSAGAIVSLLSAAELWSADRSPPRRFRPGAARHAELFDVINDDNGDERAGPGASVRNTLIPVHSVAVGEILYWCGGSEARRSRRLAVGLSQGAHLRPCRMAA
jgi:SPW repeat